MCGRVGFWIEFLTLEKVLDEFALSESMDGRLNYRREKIFESFYTVHFWRGVYGAFDLQHINNPGYNRDRGPVLVPGLRLHIDL
jgi:carbohydrate-selective porin OprB